jgi:hypothetical protein
MMLSSPADRRECLPTAVWMLAIGAVLAGFHLLPEIPVGLVDELGAGIRALFAALLFLLALEGALMAVLNLANAGLEALGIHRPV